MRYLKAALIGLASGGLLATTVLAVDMARADRIMVSQMADCAAATGGGGGVCSGSAQFGLEVPVAFAVGFAAAFIWSAKQRR